MSGHQHKKPVTRRDFLSSGLIQGTGYMMLPSVLDILLNHGIARAQAVCASTGANNMPALITIDASGGACFAWDIPPMDAGNNPLSSYSRLGLGTAPTTIQTLFANAIKRSTTGTMIPQVEITLNSATVTTATSGANATTILGKTTCIPIWTSSRDDSSTVANGIQTAAINAGLNGKLKLLGTRDSKTGVADVDAFDLPSVTPFIPRSIDDIVNSLGAPASGAFGRLAQNKRDSLMKIIKNLNSNQARQLAAASGGQTAVDLIGCSHDQNIVITQSPPTGDPRSSAIAPIWNIAANTAPTATNAVRAGMVLAALTGNSGPLGIEMGGYDYHGQGQTVQNNQHTALGTLIGQILASAQVLNRDVFIYLITDGATDSTDSATPAAPQGDSGQNGGNIMFMFKANGAVIPATKQQVGYFNGSQQNDPGSPSENIQMGSISALVNYLGFAGGMTKVNTVTSLIPSMNLSSAQILALLALGV